MVKGMTIDVLAAEVIEELKKLNYAYNTICGLRASFNRICTFVRALIILCTAVVHPILNLGIFAP